MAFVLLLARKLTANKNSPKNVSRLRAVPQYPSYLFSEGEYHLETENMMESQF